MLITSLLLSFERRDKIYVKTTYSAYESAKNVLKWTYTRHRNILVLDIHDASYVICRLDRLIGGRVKPPSISIVTNSADWIPTRMSLKNIKHWDISNIGCLFGCSNWDNNAQYFETVTHFSYKRIGCSQVRYYFDWIRRCYRLLHSEIIKFSRADKVITLQTSQ